MPAFTILNKSPVTGLNVCRSSLSVAMYPSARNGVLQKVCFKMDPCLQNVFRTVPGASAMISV